MKKVLRITFSVVAAFVTLALLSLLIVALKLEGGFWMALNAVFAYGAGTALNAFLKKKYPPKSQDLEDSEK